MLFCHITTGIKTDKNWDLLDKKGGGGFPYIVFMDSSGNVVATHETAREPAEFRKTWEKAAAFLELKRKAEGGDPAAKLDYLTARLDRGVTGRAEGEEELKKLGKLNPEQEAKAQAALATAEVRETSKAIQDDEKKAVEAGKKFLAMHKAGRALPSGPSEIRDFWAIISFYAEHEKDLAAFDESLKALKKLVEGDAWMQKWLESRERVYEELKKSPK